MLMVLVFIDYLPVIYSTRYTCFLTHFLARTPNKYNEFYFNYYYILNMSLLFKTQCIT